MKKSTIAFIEMGMLLGVVLAAYTVPRKTPLLTFLIISTGFVLIGNVLLLRSVRRIQAGEIPSGGKFWPHMYRVFAIFGLYWLVSFFLDKL